MMDRALQLATQAQWLCPPNPAVGCVIVSPLGEVLGEGHTQRAGGPHAEIMALRDATARGHSVQGATVFVTLEPCAHHGRTGPCCDALVQAGVARVVAALTDPNPRVSGAGFERLRAAGIAVEVGPGAAEARAINIGFFSRMLRGRPWVRLKAAASLDGRTALADGQSQWITGPAARLDGHRWRARAGALLTGIGTVREDDPRLDVRELDAPRQPPLALVDSHLEVSPGARLFAADRPVWVYTASDDAARSHALQDRGATVIRLPGPGESGMAKVDLKAMLQDLAAREVNELHVEAGHKLNGSLLREGLVDEWLIYLAPRLIGPGRDLVAMAPLAQLSQAHALEFRSVQAVGPDLRILASEPGRDRFCAGA